MLFLVGGLSGGLHGCFAVDEFAPEFAMTQIYEQPSRMGLFLMEKKTKYQAASAGLDWFDYAMLLLLFCAQALLRDVIGDVYSWFGQKTAPAPRPGLGAPPPRPPPEAPPPPPPHKALINVMAANEFLAGVDKVSFAPSPHRNDQRAHLRKDCHGSVYSRKNDLCQNCKDHFGELIRDQTRTLCEDFHQARVEEQEYGPGYGRAVVLEPEDLIAAGINAA